MAVDTRSRRASVLGLTLAFNLTLPLADAVVGDEDRAHVAYSYPGIAAASPVGAKRLPIMAASRSRSRIPGTRTRGRIRGSRTRGRIPASEN